jgi:hypothetical protein
LGISKPKPVNDLASYSNKYSRSAQTIGERPIVKVVANKGLETLWGISPHFVVTGYSGRMMLFADKS